MRKFPPAIWCLTTFYINIGVVGCIILILSLPTLGISEENNLLIIAYTKQRPLWTMTNKSPWIFYIFRLKNGNILILFILPLPIFLNFTHWYSSLKWQKILTETPYTFIVFPNRIIKDNSLWRGNTQFFLRLTKHT